MINSCIDEDSKSDKKEESEANVHGRCAYCPKPRPKTRVVCQNCHKPACSEHRISIILCKICRNEY